MQEPSVFAEGSYEHKKLFGINEALADLQENHELAMEMEDRKINSIRTRFEKACDPAHDPEHLRTYAYFKKVQMHYARRLADIKRTQELLEREYRVEMQRLNFQVDTVIIPYEDSVNERHQNIRERLVMEDHVRKGLMKQKQIRSQYQEKIEQLESTIRDLQREVNRRPFIYQPTYYERDVQNVAEAKDQEQQVQRHRDREISELLAQYEDNENMVVLDDQEEVGSYSSYYHVVEDEEDEEGRPYALYSRNEAKKEFAHKKYNLDLEKSRSDQLKQQLNLLENRDDIVSWRVKVGKFMEEGDAMSPKVNTTVDNRHARKRAFSDYYEDEEVKAQQGRKRIRPISRVSSLRLDSRKETILMNVKISRTPSPPSTWAGANQDAENNSIAGMGYYGPNGSYHPYPNQPRATYPPPTLASRDRTRKSTRSRAYRRYGTIPSR